MRDDHLNDGHREQVPKPTVTTIQPDIDEIENLMVDLIQGGNLELLKVILSSPDAREIKNDRRVLRAAVIFGNPSYLEDFSLLPRKTAFDRKYDIWFMTDVAISNPRLDNMEHLLINSEIKESGWESEFPNVFQQILDSDSMEAFTLWKKVIKDKLGRVKLLDKERKLIMKYYFAHVRSVKPHQEQLIIQVWEELHVSDALKDATSLGDALVHVSMTSCSVRLAKFWIDAGAPVDFRRCERYPTPFFHAVKKDSAEAAELVRFLLQCGADPALEVMPRAYSNKKRDRPRIGDEKGAKELSQWLGITWDELLAETADVRQEARTAREKAEKATKEAKKEAEEVKAKANEEREKQRKTRIEAEQDRQWRRTKRIMNIE